jgi:hypothetical protein
MTEFAAPRKPCRADRAPRDPGTLPPQTSPGGPLPALAA